MPSRAIARIDDWLQRADEVLTEQREAALSPSQAGVWDPAEEKTTICLADFERGLGDVLRRLCERPGRWILIAEDAEHPSHFWQALAFEDGSLIAETVANTFLDGNDRWTAEQEETLAGLGWQVPKPPHRPNWLWVEATTSPDVEGVAKLARRTLQDVLGLGPDDWLVLKMFGSPRRGRTPASPVTDEDVKTPLATSDPPDETTSRTNEPRRDARHCPTCRTLGILPLDQPREANGAIQDPLMLCPECEVKFTATGMRYLVARPPEEAGSLSEEGVDAWARSFVDAVLGKAERAS
jgi:hypothetical protein